MSDQVGTWVYKARVGLDHHPALPHHVEISCAGQKLCYVPAPEPQEGRGHDGSHDFGDNNELAKLVVVCAWAIANMIAASHFCRPSAMREAFKQQEDQLKRLREAVGA